MKCLAKGPAAPGLWGPHNGLVLSTGNHGVMQPQRPPQSSVPGLPFPLLSPSAGLLGVEPLSNEAKLLPTCLYQITPKHFLTGLSWWLSGKESAYKVRAIGDGSVPGSGRSPGGG